MILLATLTTLVPYAFSAAAQLMLSLKDRALFDAAAPDPRRDHRDARVRATRFWMIYGAGQEIIAKGFMLLLRGHPGVRRASSGGSQAETAAGGARARDRPAGRPP